MSIWEEIFSGELNPYYEINRKTPEISAVEDEICGIKGILEDKLSTDKAEILEKLDGKQCELEILMEKRAFTYGFKLAVMIMLETFKTDNC